jgi:hypothetical protein
VRDIDCDETLLALAHQYALLERIAVVDGAFALEHIGNGFDALVVMRLGHRSRWHRQDIHADLRPHHT